MLSENSLQKVLYAIKELIPNSMQRYQRQMLKKTSKLNILKWLRQKNQSNFPLFLIFIEVGVDFFPLGPEQSI